MDTGRNLVYALTSLGEVYRIKADNSAERWLHLADSGLVGIAYNPVLDRLYISSYANQVYVYDAATKAALAKVTVPGEPHALAVNTNGNALFVARAAMKSIASTGTITPTRALERLATAKGTVWRWTPAATRSTCPTSPTTQ